MTLENTIRAEIKTAMKSGDAATRDILRLLLGEMQLKSSEKKLTEAEELKIVQKMIKNNNETIKLIENIEQREILEKENIILGKLLPAVMSEEETKNYVMSLGIDFSKIAGNGPRMGAVKRHVSKPEKTIDNSILIKILENI